MTAQVPLRLARRADPPAAADAFLLFAGGFGPLAVACAGLGGSALPDVYPVRGGFVLVPREAGPRPVPGAVRLRRVSGDLFIPADATLLPALLPDEIAALTTDRGLVVLPGGQVLAFDPRSPLPASRWLAPARVRRESWRPFPPRPEGADRLTRIERPSPPAAVIEILSRGQPDDADPLPGPGEGDTNSTGSVPEDARPPSGSLPQRVAAGVKLGFGQLLAWLGRNLKAPGLARRGADLARKAMEQVPRLSEKLLGAQEAALREVLRQLRSGDVERALRRAPTAVPDPNARPTIGRSANLGTRDPRYSLRDLIGSGGGGPATAWLGGGDVWEQLAREYRRLAQEAAARGDHRRAAYLYGVLLRDLRAAANALMAGGLFRDAAVIFRDKLKDESAAAGAFEQAGDYDEAVRLYDRLERFEQAGDLLHRIGDDGRAADYFTRAADRHAANERWVAAGDLMRQKTGDRHAAARYYRAGWANGRAEMVACGERLLDELLASEGWPETAAFFTEAERALAPPRAADAGRFFNYALHVGSDFLPAELRDDLADQARRVFAAHLRAAGGARAATLVGDLFGRRGGWPGPVVRDATFAVRGQPRPAEPPAAPPVQLVRGTVTAVLPIRDTSGVVVAAAGSVVFHDPDTGRVEQVCATSGHVLALSADSAGKVIYVLSEMAGDHFLRCFLRAPGSIVQPMGQTLLEQWNEEPHGWYLEPVVATGDDPPRVTLSGPRGRFQASGWYVQLGEPDCFLADGSNTRLLLREGTSAAWDWDSGFMRYLVGSNPPQQRYRWVPNWSPAPGATRPLDWLTPAAGLLEVAGVDADGVLHWSEFDARSPGNPQQRVSTATNVNRFRAVCLVSPGSVAAVNGRNELHWFKVWVGSLRLLSVTRLTQPGSVVALASRPAANEVVAVFADGSVSRVPRP